MRCRDKIGGIGGGHIMCFFSKIFFGLLSDMWVCKIPCDRRRFSGMRSRHHARGLENCLNNLKRNRIRKV